MSLRQQGEPSPLRAVVYARYSSESQPDASIEDQVRICRERARHEGWTAVNVFSDRGVNGASVRRARYQAMLAAARAGEFWVLLTEALDRLSRDQEDIAGLYKRLSFEGI